MAKRQPIVLGGKTFRNKTEGAKYVRKLMESYNHDDEITGENLIIVMDTIKRFPDANQRIGAGISNIYLQVGIGTDRYFLVRRDDNTWITCGYKSAFFPKTDLDRFRAACRQVTADETYGRIAFHMGKPPGLEVHHVKPFEEVINDFIGLYNVDVSSVKYRKNFNRTEVFQDTKLQQKFMDYCRQFAVLRLLTKEDHKIETAKQWRKKND